MSWMLVSRRHRRRAAAWVGAGVAAFVVAVLVGGMASPANALYWGTAAFVSFVFCVRKAMVLWRVDEMVFHRQKKGNVEPRPFARPATPAIPERLQAERRKGLVLVLALAILAALTTCSVSGQQTIFNMPSADVLDPGKTYLEVDELFRPVAPQFSSTTVRGVVGVLPQIEVGLNFGGLVSPGPVIPTVSVAVKAQPIHVANFALTARANGLLYLRGSRDGDPAGFAYALASYRCPTKTRISVGGYYASAGYAKPDSTGGAIATFEQSLPWVKGLTLAADWCAGQNAIGYLSPGLIYTSGHWTAYASWTFKNGDAKGNGGLLELGYAF